MVGKLVVLVVVSVWAVDKDDAGSDEVDAVLVTLESVVVSMVVGVVVVDSLALEGDTTVVSLVLKDVPVGSLVLDDVIVMSLVLGDVDGTVSLLLEAGVISL